MVAHDEIEWKKVLVKFTVISLMIDFVLNIDVPDEDTRAIESECISLEIHSRSLGTLDDNNVWLQAIVVKRRPDEDRECTTSSIQSSTSYTQRS